MACVNLWPWERFGPFVCDEMMRSSVYSSVVRMRVVVGWLSERVCVSVFKPVVEMFG